MRFATAALILAAIAQPGWAATDCSKEANDALDKQRASGSYRMKSSMINERGFVKMTVDYALPGRMHQKIQIIPSPTITETILIHERAWSNDGKKWKSLSGNDAEALGEGLKKNVEEKSNHFLAYTCEGKTEFDGVEHLGYRAIENKKKIIPGAATQKPPIRILYVNAKTGLPGRTTVANPSNLARPFFKAVYTYPKDIKIEPPATAKN